MTTSKIAAAADDQRGTAEASGVEVSGLTVVTGRRRTPIVEDIAFSIRPGSVMGLVGESGSGKSTVGVALLGHARRGLTIASGEVHVDGRNVLAMNAAQLRRCRGSLVSYIPQDPGNSLNPGLRVGFQLEEALVIHPDALATGQTPRERVLQVLDEVGLPATDDLLKRYPHQLSGGQQQRVAIAMAFVCRPRLIVLDEPTTGLDVTTQRRVLDTVRELTQRHRTCSLYVSHDLAVVAGIADHTSVMYAGRIIEAGPTAAIFRSARHPYTAGLVRAAPSAKRATVLVGIEGRPPRPGGRPSGCSFAPRCARVQDDCRQALPALTVLEPDHAARCFHPLAPDAVSSAAASAPEFEPEPGSVLVVRDLVANYAGTPVLHEVNLTVAPGRCTAIVGESGSGKTTLARCIAGLHQSWAGTMTYRDTPLAQQPRRRTIDQRRELQYVFQNPYASLNPRMTVGANIEEPLRYFTSLSGKQRRDKVLAVLDDVALGADFADRMPDQLSGGERQRVAVGRALTVDPELLICDEITSALDVSVQALLVEQLRRLQHDRGLSMLFITHNLAVVRSIAQDVIVLSHGIVVEHGPVEQVLENPQHPYTVRLLADLPHLEAAV